MEKVRHSWNCILLVIAVAGLGLLFPSQNAWAQG